MLSRALLVIAVVSLCPSAFAMGKKREDTVDYSKYVNREVPSELATKFIQDLKTLEQFSGNNASPLHKKYFGEIAGKTYIDFVFRSLTQLSYDPDETFSTAYVRGSEIVITSDWLDPQMPQIVRLSLLIHEAAHTHGGPWHMFCPTPYLDEQGNPARLFYSGRLLAGLPACDHNLDGAYAFQATFLGNIAANCVTCTEKIKLDAKLYLPDTLLRFAYPDQRSILKADLHRD